MHTLALCIQLPLLTFPEFLQKAMKNPKVDAYIENAEAFAQPLLQHLRSLVHRVCPGVEETIKWGFPNFIWGGTILCSMASFKEHCAFNFWRGKELPDPDGILEVVGKTAMGNLGRIRSLEDLPAETVLLKYITAAMQLNESAEKAVRKRAKMSEKELLMPAYFSAGLAENALAQQHFQSFSPSEKKEYIQWLEEAKTEATRQKRLLTALEWLAAGKVRNWKYLKKPV